MKVEINGLFFDKHRSNAREIPVSFKVETAHENRYVSVTAHGEYNLSVFRYPVDERLYSIAAELHRWLYSNRDTFVHQNQILDALVKSRMEEIGKSNGSRIKPSSGAVMFHSRVPRRDPPDIEAWCPSTRPAAGS